MELNLYKYTDYRRFIRDYIEAQPKKGRGMVKKIAEHLGTHSVVVSQVLADSRDFTLEQALDLADFFGFTVDEGEYLMMMVQYSRAGTERLRKLLKRKLAQLAGEAETAMKVAETTKPLDETAKGVYYSSWYYSGTRLLAMLPDVKSAEDVAERFDLPIAKVREILKFLLQHELVSDEGGVLTPLEKSTHTSHHSPFSIMHAKNWRFKAMQKIEEKEQGEIFYTAPVALSEDAIFSVKEELNQALARVVKIAESAKSEKLACLNMDWFRW